MASRRHNNWLAEQSAAWVADGLVSIEQAEQIRARYPVSTSMSWGLLLLTAIGAIIFGLGVILFFAYNWDELHKYAKLALIFSALLIAHFLGLYFSSKQDSVNRNKSLIEGFHVLGTMMFGAGIWLIAQIYHIDEHYPTAFAIWGLGALALAWALPSVIQGLIATALLLSWGLAETLDFNSFHYLSLIVMTFGVLSLAWVLKSRALLFCALSATLVLCFLNVLQQLDESILFYLLFAVATLHICIARFARYSAFPASAEVLRTIGIAVYGFLLFITTFEDLTEELIQNQPEQSAFVFSLIMLGLALLGWIVLTIHMYKVGIARTKFAEIILVLIAIVLMILLLVGVFRENIALCVLLLNSILAAHCVLLIIIGTDELNWRHVAVGCCALGLLVFLRFNDLFQSLLMRSLVFLVVGAMLFFIGHIYAKQSAQKSALKSESSTVNNATQGQTDA